MIRLKNVNKYFNKRKANEIHAINNTSIELGDKGLVTFLGNSGCGKTTLLNAIGGLDKVDTGEIFIDDEKITSRFSGKCDDIRNANIGYIFQNYNLIEDLTVFENVAIVLRMIGFKDEKEISDRVMYVLRRIGIERYKNRPAKMLSGGERQRVGIARAIVKNPKVIIADEPTGNLDSGNTIEIMNIIKAISKTKLVILVTHEKDIAKFYADRIIEIVDGRIVSDGENMHKGDLDYRIDNKIYLKDLPNNKEFVQDNVKVEYFSDTDEPINIKVVVKNNNIYVETDSNMRKGSETVELINDNYKKLSKEIYEEYEFNYDDVYNKASGKGGKAGEFKPKYTSIVSLGKSIKDGFKKIHRYSKIKKVLLLGFIIASMFITFSVSNYTGITTITDSKFMTANKDYLSIHTGKLNQTKLDKYKEFEDVSYVLPGNSEVNFIMPLDDYLQSRTAKNPVSGSLASRDLLSKDQIIHGEVGKTNSDLVVDKMILDGLKKDGRFRSVGIMSYKDYIGRTLYIPNLGNFVISGVSDSGSPCIYSSNEMLMPITVFSPSEKEAREFEGTGDVTARDGALMTYGYFDHQGDVNIYRGRAPENDYEAVISRAKAEETAIGKTISTEVNGKKLTVVGYYDDARNRDVTFVNEHTKEMSVFPKFKSITIASKNKDNTIEKIQETGAKVDDVYEVSRENYMKNIKDNIKVTLAVAAVLLGVSLLEIYLMLRASFLSRVKEVGVLRSIGVKKKDIYKMFSGEIVALTLLTAIPGVGFMSYLLHGLTKIDLFAQSFAMNPTIVVESFVIVFVFNLLAGLLPVFTTLRKTPAEILSRNDVN